ncbi:MAG: hypothetical protein ACHQ49_11130 [Elusimicrobiota bacterium]
MRIPVMSAILLSAALAPFARAQTLPPLDQQKVWTEADKKDFLQYLNSNQPAPTGTVRDVGVPAAGGFSSRSAQALELGPDFVALFPLAGNRYAPTVVSQPGGRALYERHFAPWVRAYAGIEVNPLRQKRLDDQWTDLTRWSVPAGLEFALVPLSMPQTRCVLLRLGIAASDVAGPGARSDFNAPLMGTSAAWNLGLGYEWQIPDSRWRLNAAVDGLRSFTRNTTGYYGLGATAAVVLTF